MKFIISVDTEADNQWLRPSGLALNNLRALPRFQELCSRYDFPVTYLITYEVAQDVDAVKTLREFEATGLAEIGTHLHPWSTLPYPQGVEWERIHHRFPSELSEGELRAKLRSLTDLIIQQFGHQPASFRAGRWGFSHELAKILCDFGYRVDSSVTPGISWRDSKGDPGGKGGPNFCRAPIHPYKINGIIEVPMTVLPVGGLFERGLRRIFRRFRWFRIFPDTSLNDLLAVYEAAVFYRLPYVQFMIHSSELAVDCSPWVKTQVDVERTFALLELLFKEFKKRNIVGQVLSRS
ncbi:MAG: hypothetical protein AAB589_02435 [Patescibacteria group bacterium]